MAGNKEQSRRVYLFDGRDEGLKEKALEELIAQTLEPDSRDFDFEVVDGSSATSERVVSATSILPFSAELRVVLVRRINQMPESEQKMLAEKLPKLPKSTCLILTVPAPELGEGGRPKKGSAPVKELTAAVKDTGRIQHFEPKKRGDAIQLAAELISKEGKKAPADALKVLAERTGGDYAILTTEIRKLSDYVGDRKEITARDVRHVTAETLEERIFTLIDAIGERKEAQALALTRDYLESAARIDTAAARLIPMIARQMRYIWQVKILQEANINLASRLDELPDAIKSLIPRDVSVLDLVRRQEWQGRKLSAQARNFNRSAIERAMELLAEADLSMKGINDKIDDVRTIVELLVVRLCRS